MEDLTFIVMEEEEKKSFNFNLDDTYYTYKKDDVIIGYARVNVVAPHKIYIFINDNMRSNGYGTKMFSEVLKLLKENNINNVEVEVPVGNVSMIRILERNNGKEITRIENIAHYLVPIF